MNQQSGNKHVYSLVFVAQCVTVSRRASDNASRNDTRLDRRNALIDDVLNSSRRGTGAHFADRSSEKHYWRSITGCAARHNNASRYNVQRNALLGLAELAVKD